MHHTLEFSLKHELSHAADLCREGMNSCEECMIEEKKAYYRSGELTQNWSCTTAAWASCEGFYCLWAKLRGKTARDYMGIGWPVVGGGAGRIPNAP